MLEDTGLIYIIIPLMFYITWDVQKVLQIKIIFIPMEEKITHLKIKFNSKRSKT